MVNKNIKRTLWTVIAVIFIICSLTHLDYTSPNKVFSLSSPSVEPHTEEEQMKNISWVEKRALVYSKRKERVKAVCDSSKNIHYVKQTQNFIFDIQDGLAYCLNLKVRFSNFKSLSDNQ